MRRHMKLKKSNSKPSNKRRVVYQPPNKSPLRTIMFIMVLAIITLASFAAIFHKEVEMLVLKHVTENPKQTLVPKEQRHQPSYNAASVLNVTPQDVIDVQQNAAMMNQVAQIVIPSIGVDLPIQEGVDYYTELIGAGEQYPRSIIKPGGRGNYVLASHHIEGFWNTNLLFTSINKLNGNDIIYVNDDTNIYTYKVTNNEQVSVEDVSWIEPTPSSGKAYITLYTCVSDATSKVLRQIIRGELIKVDKNDEHLPQEIKNAFYAQGFNQMTPWERASLR